MFWDTKAPSLTSIIKCDLDQLYVSHVKLAFITHQAYIKPSAAVVTVHYKKEDISTIHDMYITEFEYNVYKLPFNIMFT